MEVIKIEKLNESYSILDADIELLREISYFLKVEKPGAFFNPRIKAGFESPYKFFTSLQNKKLLIMNGHLQLLSSFGIVPEKENSGFEEKDIQDFLTSIKNIIPFQLYDFQEKAFKECLKTPKQLNICCTGSGKSLVIALLAEFLRRKNKKGTILVPNINLLTQFSNDIKEYNLKELHKNTHIIGGGNTERHFNKPLTISTWQSLLKCKEKLEDIDFIITDESHRFSSIETSEIVKSTLNCKYKWGFTGTLPEDPAMKMELFGSFGLPKNYISMSELIEKGLAVPIKINAICFKYSEKDKRLFKEAGVYAKQLKFIKEHPRRNEFIANLSTRLEGNTLVLGQHIEHLKTMYLGIMEKLYPDVKNIKNKDITGKHSFDFQKKYGVYYISGSDDAKTRELTRKILEEKHYNVYSKNGDCITIEPDEINNYKGEKIIEQNKILVSGYSLLGTGVNIKKLHNIIFASPLKAYTAITQSVGRGVRLHESKDVFNIFDLIDDFGFRKPGGIFYKQFLHREKTSYNREEFPILKTDFSLKGDEK